MYYEETIFHGIKIYRTSPNGKWYVHEDEISKTQPSELEMHRADYYACKKLGFESPGELISAYSKTVKESGDLYVALSRLVKWAEKQVCMHDDCYYGGSLWIICNQCGMRWNHRKGERPPEDPVPEEIKEAHNVLDSI